MPIITLTSDWGTNDFYRAAVVGKIYSLLPDVSLVDITHEIPSFDVMKAAFVVQNSAFYFPKGSIHLIDVHFEQPHSSAYPHYIIKHKGHYLIGEGNPMFWQICGDEYPEMVYEIHISDNSSTATFVAADLYVQAACHLAGNKPIEEIASPVSSMQTVQNFVPTYNDNLISGMIMYIDKYDNAITNISRDLFFRLYQGRRFVIRVGTEKLTQIHQSYFDVGNGSLVALFSSTGFLELAQRGGKLAMIMNLRVKSSITIEFQ